MAPPHMEVTLDKWQKWVSALIEGDNSVVANLNSAADDLERNIKLQNEGKWGTEEGPQAFARVYKSYLEQEVAALRAMAENAGNFAAKVQIAIGKLQDGDTTAEATLNEEIASIDAVYVSPQKSALLSSKDPTVHILGLADQYRY